MTIKAIETKYNGYLFRSRLEARWAVFFDTLGLEYHYEPEGFDLDGIRYLPDFWLPQVRMWTEVKPGPLNKTEKAKAICLAQESGHPVLLLIGVPDNKFYWAIEPEGGLVDYALSMFGDYPLTENRFFCMPGMDFDACDCWEDTKAAVLAARQARFGT